MQWMPKGDLEVFEMWSDVHVDLHLGDVESEQKKKEITYIKRITQKSCCGKEWKDLRDAWFKCNTYTTCLLSCCLHVAYWNWKCAFKCKWKRFRASHMLSVHGPWTTLLSQYNVQKYYLDHDLWTPSQGLCSFSSLTLSNKWCIHALREWGNCDCTCENECQQNERKAIMQVDGVFNTAHGQHWWSDGRGFKIKRTVVTVRLYCVLAFMT